MKEFNDEKEIKKKIVGGKIDFERKTARENIEEEENNKLREMEKIRNKNTAESQPEKKWGGKQKISKRKTKRNNEKIREEDRRK